MRVFTELRGVGDAPGELGMGLAAGETRWRGMTSIFEKALTAPVPSCRWRIRSASTSTGTTGRAGSPTAPRPAAPWHRRRAPRARRYRPSQAARDVDAMVLPRSEEHTSELQSPDHLVCRLLLEKKKK